MPALKINPHDGSPHIHSYVRRKGGLTYGCSHPQCTHYLPKYDLKGKLSLCPQCMNATLILDKEALKRERPLCLNCRGTKQAKEVRKLTAQLKELGIE